MFSLLACIITYATPTLWSQYGKHCTQIYMFDRRNQYILSRHLNIYQYAILYFYVSVHTHLQI